MRQVAAEWCALLLQHHVTDVTEYPDYPKNSAGTGGSPTYSDTAAAGSG